MPLAPGDRLGSHEIIGLLGAGGMGEVYRAQDTKLNRQVAIKVLPEAHVGDPERLARFQREAQAVAALSHPNIAGIFEFADSGEIKFLVLELIEGDTLAERIRRGPIPVEDALVIAKQILEALEAAHERGICHRDLKPANVKLMTSRGGSSEPPTVKVLDFGLAKFLQSGSVAPNLTQSPTLSLAGTYPGMILGTAGYMSPEQAKGFEADQRSDIFSFGCVFYELLTGGQAFEGETASEILASILKTEPDFTALPARLNPRIADVLRRCLEKNPKKRWHAAADVRVEIEAVMGRALVANDPRAAALARPLWRRSLPVAAGILVGALSAGYAAWMLKPEAPRRVTRFTIPLLAGQEFTNSNRSLAALSPDGQTLVYVANARLNAHSFATLETQTISGSEAISVTNPTFSPDGKSIAYWSGDQRTITRIPITGGMSATICPAPSNVHGMSWNDQGILFAEEGRGIFEVSPAGGEPRLIVAIPSDQIATAPQRLPGGAILFSLMGATENWNQARVLVRPAHGGEPITLINGGADGRYLPTGHLVYAVSGVLMAVRFDPSSLTVSGTPVPVLSGVMRSGLGQAASGTAQLTTSSTGDMAYIPGPAVIQTSEASDLQLAVFDRKGAFQRLNLTPGGYRFPRVSPDGKFVGFELESIKEADVWLFELSGRSAMRRLTFGGRNRSPIWSPDGRWVTFQSDRDGDLALFRQRADGEGVAERLTRPDTDTAHVPHSWSPDGSTLLFSAQKDQNWSLWMRNANGQTAPFADVRSIDSIEAAFSPDGRWVVYQAHKRGGNREVLLEPFPPTGAKFLVRNGGHPYWSPKGDELVLNVGPGRSVIVPVTTKPQVSFGTSIELSRIGRAEGNPGSSRRNVDFLPDGDHFVGVATESQEPPRALIFVLNWFDELRQKAPRP